MAKKTKLPPGMYVRGAVYYCRFRAGGRQIRKRLSSNFQVACQLLNELKARADRAEYGITDNDYPWEDLKREFLAWARQAIREPDRYEADLGQFERYKPVRKIKAIDHSYIYGFRSWRLNQGVCPRTVNKQVTTLHNMLAKGVMWGRIGSNPIAGIRPLPHDEPTKQRRSLGVAEVEVLFDVSPPHLARVWRMFMTSGIRRGELVNLEFEHVNFDRRTATVRKSKNHKPREIPLSDEVLAMIAELRDQAKDRQSIPGVTPPGRFSRTHVFVTRANTPLRNNLLRDFYACCAKAGIEDAHPGGSVDIHSLRVSFTTIALEHGAKPKAVQEILGHSTLGLTMSVYARATDRGKREAIGALPFAKVSPPKHVVPFAG